MRSDRERYSPLTRRLLDYETAFRQISKSSEATSRELDEKTQDTIKNLWDEVSILRPSSTSRELNHALQMLMLFLSAHLTHFLKAKNEKIDWGDIKIVSSVFYKKHKTLVSKPCFFFPGHYSTLHPTIDLDSESAQKNSRHIGVSGLALVTNRVIHCDIDSGLLECSYQIQPLGLKAKSLLVIPLSAFLTEILKDFLNTTPILPETTPPACCRSLASPRDMIPKALSELKTSARGTIAIECTTAALTSNHVKNWLQLSVVKDAFTFATQQLTIFQKQRGVYKALRVCASLQDLSQFEMGSRQALRTLLREISELCSGADVTLHLKDFFRENSEFTWEEIDKHRCTRLVVGFGSRVRGFLVDERYGGGLVGAVIDRKNGDGLPVETPDKLNAEEIADALREQEGGIFPFRRLMKDTQLNVAVPIIFFSRAIGAINLEWSSESAPSLKPKEQDLYVSKLSPLLVQIARYLALVIDFFDDHNPHHQYFIPPIDPPEATGLSHIEWQQKIINLEQSQRQAMAYYANRALADLDKQAKARTVSSSNYNYLKDIIHGVGYLVTFDEDLRVLVSVRRKNSAKNSLVLVAEPHGFEAEPGDDSLANIASRALDLDSDSVLVKAALLGIPIFGNVTSNSESNIASVSKNSDGFLTPHPLCRAIAPRGTQSLIGDVVNYRAAGRNPKFEAGLPLIFGGRILGTFDFELFSHRDAGSKEAPATFDGYQLRPFLDWARIITLCMARHEDLLAMQCIQSTDDQKSRNTLDRFFRLCALIVARVPVPHTLLQNITKEYVRTLAPVKDLIVKDAESRDEGTNFERQHDETHLWLGPDFLGTARLLLEEQPENQLGNTTEKSHLFDDVGKESGIAAVLQRILVGSYRSTLSLYSRMENPDLPTRDFCEKINRIKKSIEDLRSDDIFRQRLVESPDHSTRLLSAEQLDGVNFLVALFGIIHNIMQEVFGFSRSVAWEYPQAYGWAIHLASMESLSTPDASGHKATIFRCGSQYNRWISMVTREMKMLIISTRESPDPYKDIRSRFESHSDSSKIDELDEFLEKNPSVDLRDGDRLLELFTELLGSRTIIHPISEATCSLNSGKQSHTRRVAIHKDRPHGFPDLNRSPYRSRRVSKWFFEDASYTLIGIPICFGGECIAIINIFRRREHRADLAFFKSDEINATKAVKSTIENLIAKELQLFLANRSLASADRINCDDAKTTRENIIRHIRRRSKQVICAEVGFARNLQSVSHMVAALRSEVQRGEDPLMSPDQANIRHVVMDTSDPRRWNPSDIMEKKGGIIAVIDSFAEKANGSEVPHVATIGGLIERMAEEHCVIVFSLSVERSPLVRHLAALNTPIVARVLETPAQKLESLAARLGFHLNGDASTDVTAILCRRSSPFSIADLVITCGNQTDAFPIGVVRLLVRLRDLESAPPRLLHSWLTFGKAALSPESSSSI